MNISLERATLSRYTLETGNATRLISAMLDGQHPVFERGIKETHVIGLLQQNNIIQCI